MVENREIVLYHYPFSPYARRVREPPQCFDQA